MRTIKQAGFFRPFIGGFALGALALVGVQLADGADATPRIDTARSAVVTPIS